MIPTQRMETPAAMVGALLVALIALGRTSLPRVSLEV
jgi:hypothetical protein